MSRLSKNILLRRKELHLTPARAAEGAEMPVERWKLIESGKVAPHTDELEAISNVLRVAPHILMGWQPEGRGIIQRLERTEHGYAAVIEFEKPYRMESVDLRSQDGYIRIEFEEVEP